LTISHSVLLRTRNFSDKDCRKKSKHILGTIISFFENRALYEIMWKNIVASGRPQMTIWRMIIACWISKATKALSEYFHTYCSSSATMVIRTRLNVT